MRELLIKKTENISKLLEKISCTSEVGCISEVLMLIRDLNLKVRKDEISRQFLQRDADQILKDGYLTGCHDDAILFLTFISNFDFDFEYIEAIDTRWLESPMEEKKVMGHVFVKVGDLLIDPQRKVIYVDGDWVLSRYEIFGKGKEPYDLGLIDFSSMMTKFMDFKEEYKKRN